MITDVRGKDDNESYHKAVAAMIERGHKAIRVVCEKCGTEGFCFRESVINEEGYSKYPCTECGGKMKKEFLSK